MVSDKILMLIPILPLCGAILVRVLSGQGARQWLSGWIATLFSASSFYLVWTLFTRLSGGVTQITANAWTWFAVPPLKVDMAFAFDHLAAVMCLVITGVGSLIHLYAIGYMAEDKHRSRFFSYLNLFLFSMLLLVLGNNLLVMFVGWEGVGLCSYLLIGFWFKEMPNAVAGQKAFVVNRIGDAGFLLGIFTLFLNTGTIDFLGLSQTVPHLPPGVIEAAAFLLFIGAMGKSAQIPLYIWLPDAMAGPTPVSALIHAATMVTAGVYMMARLSFLFAAAPATLVFVSIIGASTALLAASIALVQNDIKKVLAYSTVSQLGYMFMAMGAGAFSNGIYHVVTHAFFKACLFMAAGSVIMGCHHEQDMRHFGGLWKKMPVTFLTYFVATLAIAGFPFLSGFYSKDAILWTVYSNAGSTANVVLFGQQLSHILWGVGAFTAFLTAFYMTRSLVLTFFGSYRGHAHPHESPWVVTVPLLVLAGLSGVFAYLYGEHLIAYLATWTRGDMLGGHEAFAHNHEYHRLEQTSIVIAISGIVLALITYTKLGNIPKAAAQKLPFLYKALSNKWWVDELYNAVIVKPLAGISDFFFRGIDRGVVDATVNGTGMFVEANGDILSRFHSGRISLYALLMFLGSLFLIIFWLL